MLHYYFRNKEKLFDTIFTEVTTEFLPVIFSILESDEPFFKKIERFCAAYIQQEIKTPYVPMFIINEINRDPKALLKRILSRQKPSLEKVIAQVKDEIKKGRIKPIEPFQILLNTISLCIFPYLARPMIQTITGMDLAQFNRMMEQRSGFISKMIIDSIKA